MAYAVKMMWNYIEKFNTIIAFRFYNNDTAKIQLIPFQLGSIFMRIKIHKTLIILKGIAFYRFLENKIAIITFCSDSIDIDAVHNLDFSTAKQNSFDTVMPVW